MARTPDDINEVLAMLASGIPQDRGSMLQVLAESPTGEAAIRDAILPLLEDRAICVTPPPLRFLEVRRLAAQALAAERARAGITEPVTLLGAAPILDMGAIGLLADQHLGPDSARWSAGRCYRALRDTGLLPLRDLVIHPER
jgi:hypothetical protein